MAIEISGKIEGLDELMPALAHAQRDLPAAMDDVDLEVARLTVSDAERRAQARGGSYLAALRLGGIGKPTKAQHAAAIVLGGVNAPMTLGAEFGAKQWPQFGPWTGDGDTAGHAVWPALRAVQEKAGGMYLDAVDEVIAPAFPD